MLSCRNALTCGQLSCTQLSRHAEPSCPHSLLESVATTLPAHDILSKYISRLRGAFLHRKYHVAIHHDQPLQADSSNAGAAAYTVQCYFHSLEQLPWSDSKRRETTLLRVGNLGEAFMYCGQQDFGNQLLYPRSHICARSDQPHRPSVQQSVCHLALVLLPSCSVQQPCSRLQAKAWESAWSCCPAVSRTRRADRAEAQSWRQLISMINSYHR